MAELEQLNANALNGIRKALTVVPENLTQLLDLAKVLYPDRIVILPDAYRSAKKFDGILTEEWEILVAVATTLWDLCFKETVNDRLGSEFKKRTGYELARGESGTTCAMPNLMKLRKRMYKGKEIDISPHIKGRNIKAAFRLHFYIDRDEEKIVIGHAGEHMISYCKVILRNEARDAYDQRKRKLKHEQLFGEMSPEELNKLITTDRYFQFERDIVEDGLHFIVCDQGVYDALMTLPGAKRKIVLLSYFGEMNDREIGDALGTGRANVQYHRSRALAMMRKTLEQESEEY